MKKGYQAITYIVIILILVSGLALFLWRDNVLGYLNENSGMASLESIARIKTTSNDTLDTKILTDDRFLALKNNVVKFDFDSICKVPVGKVAATSTTVLTIASTTNPAVASTTPQTQPAGCLVGNSIPFPVTIKKAN